MAGRPCPPRAARHHGGDAASEPGAGPAGIRLRGQGRSGGARRTRLPPAAKHRAAV